MRWKPTADHNDDCLLAPAERDLRLDLMRGIGQWMVFLDHIPYDVVSWLTLRNYGFSDAAEFFVFISGYTARLRLRSGDGPWAVSRRHQAPDKTRLAALRRTYFPVPVFVARISRAAHKLDNPM
jgi:hypothetical protein